ncbi:hypothetical protein G7085_06920 [Tessaracoccus sp. HDW20]|uniref:hypothetical protein n=1 Tax=Tessaracoccus coleopterorum TaxID=2714950 RepID=UPI0018D39448|nr:hypothetical protein [Tessaracoccus coleopterorum]NHB84428.1 hypothetical protein [Tessaracoccus coleopterorum]
MVGGVGEQLHQGDAEVGLVTFSPVRHGDGHPVEQQPPEGGVVLGEVVDHGPGRLGVVVAGHWSAVEVGGAVEPEGDVGTGVAGIGARDVDEAHRVGRQVALPVEPQPQAVVAFGVVAGLERDPDDADAGDAPPAAHPEVGRGQPIRVLGVAERGTAPKKCTHSTGPGSTSTKSIPKTVSLASSAARRPPGGSPGRSWRHLPGERG